MLDFKHLIENGKKHDIYTNLDSILDTRLSLIYSLNKSLFSDIVKNNLNNYQSRIMDDFNGFDNRLFKELYKKRNSKMIKDPIPNYIPQLLKSYILNALEQKPGEVLTLYLNVYPYKMSNDEKINLETGIFNIFKGIINVEILDKPETEITVKFMHENIGLIVMYNGLDWIDHNLSNKNLLSLGLPDVLMIAPRLTNRIVVKKESINDFFTDFEKYLHHFVQLLFLSPRLFSIKINQ